MKDQRKPRRTNSLFITESKNKFGDKFSYGKTKYTGRFNDVVINCPIHGDINVKPIYHLTYTHGCLSCNYEIPRSIKLKKLIEKAKEIHGDKYDYSKVVSYAMLIEPVEIICPQHGSFWQGLEQHVRKQSGCPSCAKCAKLLTQEEFLSKAIAVHGDSYTYQKTVYVNGQSPIIVTCKKHGDFTQRASSHLQGNICRKCFIENQRRSDDFFIEKAKEIHGDKYDYSKVCYISNKKPVEIICPQHGSFWQSPQSHVHSKNGCRYCNESKGEREIALILNKYGLEFIREYRILPYKFRYDFFLPKFNIYIEFNGIQHYFPVDQFGGHEAFEKVKVNDELKKDLVRKNKGHLIVITYHSQASESIEKTLLSRFKKIYKYWFNVSDSIHVFKNVFDLYPAFNIPSHINADEVLGLIKKQTSNFNILF